MDVKIIAGLVLVMWLGSTDAGVSYVRWGRTACPAGVHKLFQGYMVSHFNTVSGGNAVNYLCAIDKPQFVRGMVGDQKPGSAYLTGVEMELYPAYNNVFLKDNIPAGQGLHDQNMPCVRCYVAESTDQFMMTGRPDCGNTGYDLQYKGFQVTFGEFDRITAGEVVCLDEAPEGVPGGAGNEHEAFVHPIQFKCGSLPCNAYPDLQEATCAVCTY